MERRAASPEELDQITGFAAEFNRRWQPVSEDHVLQALDRERQNLLLADGLRQSNDPVVAGRGLAFWEAPPAIMNSIVELHALSGLKNRMELESLAVAEELASADAGVLALEEAVRTGKQQVDAWRKREDLARQAGRRPDKDAHLQDIQSELAHAHGELRRATLLCAHDEQCLEDLRRCLLLQAQAIAAERSAFFFDRIRELERACRAYPEGSPCRLAWRDIRDRVEKLLTEATTLEAQRDYRLAAQRYWRMKMEDKARTLFRMAGSFEQAAEVSEESGQWSLAAADYLEAVTLLETGPKEASREKLAALLQKAKTAFEESGDAERAEECRRKFACCLGLPVITCEVRPRETLVLKEWRSAELVIRNQGYGRAARLRLAASGPAKLTENGEPLDLDKNVKDVEPQAEVRTSLPIWAKQCGHPVRVAFFLTFECQGFHSEAIRAWADFRVEPIDVDRLKALQGLSAEVLMMATQDPGLQKLYHNQALDKIRAQLTPDRIAALRLGENPELDNTLKEVILGLRASGKLEQFEQLIKEIRENAGLQRGIYEKQIQTMMQMFSQALKAIGHVATE